MRRDGAARGLAAWTLGLLFFLLYGWTAAPSIVALYDDSLEFQLVAPTFGIAHPTGYPLYTVLGGIWSRLLFPLGNWAWRMNLFSALAGAATVALLFCLIRHLLEQSLPSKAQAQQRQLAALVGAVAFGFTPLWWSQATLAEVYTLHNLLVVVALYWGSTLANGTPESAVRPLTFLALTLGLGLAHHRTIVLLGPGLVIMLWGARWFWQPSRHWVRWCGALLAPLLLYLYLPVRAGMGASDLNGSYVNHWAGFWHHVLALGYTGFFQENPLTRTLSTAQWGELWLTQYGLMGLGLGAVGVGWSLGRGKAWRCWWGLLAVLVVNVAFALAYRVGDPEVFMVPAWLSFAPFISAGVAALPLKRLGRPAIATALPLLLLLALVIELVVRGTPVNRRQEWAIHDYAVALAKVEFPPQSQVIGLEGQITALRYMQQAEGLGRSAQGVVANDPALRRQAIADTVAKGVPTFITQEVAGIAAHYSFSGEGPLVRVWPRGQAVTAPPPHPLGLAFGDGELALVGYGVERLAAAGGPTLRLLFYWQPQRPLTQDYKLSLRLQGIDGAPLTWVDGSPAVADHYPLLGVAPTTTWVPGERVADVHYLSLATSQTRPKQLYVVLYDGATVSEIGTLLIPLPPEY